MRQLRKLILGIAIAPSLYGAAQVSYDPDARIWNLSNGLISAQFQLTPQGHFLTRYISNVSSDESWTASADRPTSPIRLQTDTDLFDAATVFDLYAYSAIAIRNGMRQS